MTFKAGDKVKVTERGLINMPYTRDLVLTVDRVERTNFGTRIWIAVYDHALDPSLWLGRQWWMQPDRFMLVGSKCMMSKEET